jgi:hypothetical protein
MTRDEIKQLLDEMISARQERTNANAQLEAFKKNIARPRKPRVINDLDEWNAYVQADHQYDIDLAVIQDVCATANIADRSLENELIRLLPSQIWFHHGAFAVGVAYTNWGGYRHYVKVLPWSEDLPSLDHTHRGD